MFPWDHLLIGYVGYSVLARLWRRRVDEASMAAVAVGSQFPDLIDKPLAWTFAVVPTGTTLAHSVFVALPGSALAAAVAWRFDRPTVGVAFAVGYLLHLPADVLFGPIVFGGPVEIEGLLWPVVPKEPAASEGLIANTAYYIRRFYANLGSRRFQTFLAIEGSLVMAALVLWVRDGTPGVRTVTALASWVAR